MRYANRSRRKHFSFLHVLVVLFAMLLVVPTVFFSTEVEAANENTVNDALTAYTVDTVLNDGTTVDGKADNASNETENVIALQRAIVIDEAKQEIAIKIEKIEKEKASKKEQEKNLESAAVIEVESQVANNSANNDVAVKSTTASASQSTVKPSSGNSGCLLDIENPDPNYKPYAVKLSSVEKDLVERMVMGEAGNDGYLSMALVAQCIRDAYVMGNYSSVSQLRSDFGYYGSTNITPNQSCKDAVSFIFDQGGAAVNHRILVFYASNYCPSTWHESQNFVCAVNYQRFFDYWS